ncbi:MAG TPA: LuxR C-terminal-related transcriptional regulator [Ferruginibacter sp.]|nr:LuxR C-terminal-related transcriptional regulator [Ferruginibacter sp.]
MTIWKFISKHRTILLYGAGLALLLFLLKWLELRFIIFDHAFEVYMGAIAVIFTALGIWLALKLTKPKVHTVIVEKEVYINTDAEFIFNEAEAARLGISKRELEVLQLMAGGFSNGEIAEKLFVSLHTIKTHSSKLFEKMDVKRRTQAIEQAKRSGLIR